MLKSKRAWIIAGVGAAILTVLLVLTNGAAPSPDVVARVNGQDITTEDVEAMRARYAAHGRWIEPEQAREALITEELLYQEAEEQGYVLVDEEVAEQALAVQLARLGMTIEDLQAQLEESGLTYEEYLEEFRRELTIENYLDDAVEVPEVTEEQAREFYDDYKKQYPEELRTFEEMKSEIIEFLKQERQQLEILVLIEELREKADIEYMSLE